MSLDLDLDDPLEELDEDLELPDELDPLELLELLDLLPPPLPPLLLAPPPPLRSRSLSLSLSPPLRPPLLLSPDLDLDLLLRDPPPLRFSGEESDEELEEERERRLRPRPPLSRPPGMAEEDKGVLFKRLSCSRWTRTRPRCTRR